MKLVAIGLLALLAGAGGCASSAPTSLEAKAPAAVTRLTAAEALSLADQFVGAHLGIGGVPFDFAAYPARKATLGDDGKTWWVNYMHVPNRTPGDHFSLRIDDATGAIKVFGGA